MLRAFQTHVIRKQTELSGRTWAFAPNNAATVEALNVPVPSCWEMYPGFENYRGKATYETQFFAEGNIRLEFKGVGHFGTIFIDGEKVTSHYNAYTPFETVLCNIKPSMHTLQVEVDNAFREEYALNRPNDYMSYGGITRGVLLEELPNVHLTRLKVTPLKVEGNGWRAHVEVFCRNLTATPQKADIEIRMHENVFFARQLEIQPGESLAWTQELLLTNIESWTLEAPRLYEINAVLSINDCPIDDLIDRTGFRTVEIQGNRVLINQKPIKIKGFCRHEDHPEFGCAIPFGTMAHDLQLIKDMGGNSVRTAHYPNDELFLDLCDEMGILVWEENHARGLSESTMSNPLFDEQASQVTREMITAHYNHPSIYIWGIFNECASETALGRERYRIQYELIKTLDKTRPHSSATCRYYKDICLDMPDVVSWNMYPYWYENKTAHEMIDSLYNWTQEETGGAGKPFMITEVGAGAIYGYRGQHHDKWTEEYQAEALEKQLAEILAYESCMGVYIWQFCDCRVSKEYFDKRPRTMNNKGIVDEYRRHKLAYEAVKRIFSGEGNYWT